MVKLKLAPNRMNYLIEAAQNNMESMILEQGWEIYHKGHVRSMDLIDGIHLSAQVHVNQKYDVALNLESFPNSECDCLYEGYCKHMAAVIFNAYSAHGRPEMLLREMKHYIQAQKSRSTRSTTNQFGKTAEKNILPAMNGLPKTWHIYFEHKYYGYALNQQNSIESFYSMAWSDLTELAQSWPESLRNLFEQHVLLFILRKIEQLHQSNQSSYLSFYHATACRKMAESGLVKLTELAERFSQEDRTNAKQWQNTVELLGKWALQGKASPVEWLTVYRLLWWKLKNLAVYKELERKRLETILAAAGLTSRQKDSLLIALAHFELMDGKDEMALRRLQTISNLQPSDFFMILHEWVQREQWDRLLIWLRLLLPAMSKAKQEDLQTVCLYWQEAMKHQPTDEEWIRVMLSLLPRSYYYYTDYLIQTKRYRQWIDLQLSHQISPASLFTEHLKTIEQHDPALLLPLYHQATEKSISEKSRTAYQIALRYMRKLHTIYVRLKQVERWEDYLYLLTKKHARLRAFQEELRKGKWSV